MIADLRFIGLAFHRRLSNRGINTPYSGTFTSISMSENYSARSSMSASLNSFVMNDIMSFWRRSSR
jgi:hypothetical protein